MNSTTTEQLEEKVAELKPVGIDDNVMKTKQVKLTKETRQSLIDWILTKRPNMKIKSKSKPELLEIKKTLIEQGCEEDDEANTTIAYLQKELEISKKNSSAKSHHISLLKKQNQNLIKCVDEAEQKIIEMSIKASEKPEMKPEVTEKTLEKLTDLTNVIDELSDNNEINDNAVKVICDKLLGIHRIVNQDPDWEFSYFANADY